MMRLIVVTPTEIALYEKGVRHVRAEDSTGAFGIERGHVDFLTTLAVCVVRWRDGRFKEHYIAVRGGVLRVRGGESVEIATREAVAGDDLGRLRSEVLSTMRGELDAERTARSGVLRMEHAAIRQIYRYLRPGEQPVSGERTE